MNRTVFNPIKARKRFFFHFLFLSLLRDNRLLLQFRWTWLLRRSFLFLSLGCFFRSLWSLWVIWGWLLVNLPWIRTFNFCVLDYKPIKIFIELVLALALSRILDWTFLLPHLHKIDSCFFAVTFMLSHSFFNIFQTLWIWRCLSWIFARWLAIYSPTCSLTRLWIDPLIYYLISRLGILKHRMSLVSPFLCIWLCFDFMHQREVWSHFTWLRRKDLWVFIL